MLNIAQNMSYDNVKTTYISDHNTMFKLLLRIKISIISTDFIMKNKVNLSKTQDVNEP